MLSVICKNRVKVSLMILDVSLGTDMVLIWYYYEFYCDLSLSLAIYYRKIKKIKHF